MTNHSNISQLITKLVLVSFVTQALLPMAYAADQVVDTSGGATKTPLLDAAQNGVPIVHIARPSAGGVSHNLYQQFNVGNQGVILNNAVTGVQTELGGAIGRNLLIGSTPARIILNEVTRGGASLLQGKTEIAGSTAEFILANPNGISCNGCGFINTSRASLITGVPLFSGANLSGFNIGSGQIDIGIGGLNALNTAELDLISRSLSVSGAIYAQNAYVITGLNTVDYASLEATPFLNTTTKPTLAVDIAQLGGMYANQIYLLATEQGVGVNNRGRLEAQGGGLSLDVNGTLTNSGLLKSGNGLALANGTIIASATHIENNLGTVQGDGLVLMQARGNFNNIAASIQGEQVRLNAGATLTSESAIIGASKDVVLSAGTDLNIVAGAVQAGGNISMLSGKDLDISPLVNTNSNTVYGTRTQYVVNTAGGWVSKIAGMAGYQTVCGKSNIGMGMAGIIYGGGLGGVSGGCTGPQTVAVQVRDGSSVTTATIQNNGSLIEAAGNIDLRADKGSISLDALSMTAGDSITAQASAIALFGSKDAKTRSSYTPIKGGFVFTSNLDETLVYGGLNAGWDISLLATGDSTVTGEAAEHEGKIFVTGSRINADKGHLSLLGTGDIDIANDVTRDQTYYEYYKKKKSFFKKKTTHIINSTEIGQIEPSIISANSISIGADRDLNIVASDIIADNAIGLYAGQDLNILSTGEIYHSYNYRKVKKSGIFSSGGFGITIGSQSKTERTTTDNLTQITSSVSSLNGDINATAGNQYLQLSSELLTPQGNINIAAKEAAIHSNNNTQSVLQSIQTRQTGLTIGVSSPLLTAGQTIANVAEASRRTSDSRMQALGMLTAGLTVYNNFDNISKFAQNPTSLDALGGASVGISFGTSKTSFESLTKTSLPQESILTAGRDINITATGDKANEQGDISLIGTMANAGGNVSVIAANDINLAAAIGTTTEVTKKKSSSASIGISIDTATNGVSATLGVSNSRGFSNGWGTTYFPTELTAKQALIIESGRHTTLKGATVSGEKVTANIGKNFIQTGEAGNLTISSPQDASHYIAKESSSGFNISVPLPLGSGIPSVGLNASQLKLLSDYQSAKQQTAIRVGTGGFDIKVNGHTQLNGGAIASTAEAAKNNLITQTLDFTNLVNRENTSGISTAISLNLSGTAQSIYAGSGVGTANINQSSYGHTLAAIAPANVIITRPDLQLAYDKKYADATRAPLQAVLNQTNTTIASIKAQQAVLQQQIITLQGGATVVGSIAYIQAQLNAWMTQRGRVPQQIYYGRGNQLALQLKAASDALSNAPAQLAVLDTQLTTLTPTQLAQQIAVNAIQDTGATLKTINRDPNTAHKPVTAVFDKTKATKELQAGVAITMAFGQSASKAVGDYAVKQRIKANELTTQARNTSDPTKRAALEKEAADLNKNWQENGTAKLALHAIIGGLTAGDVSGALGAAGSQAVIAKIAEKINTLDIPQIVKSALIQSAGASIGAALGSIAGNASSGAGSALNATANNWLKHEEELDLLKFKQECTLGNNASCNNATKLEILNIARNKDLMNACIHLSGEACANQYNLDPAAKAYFVKHFGLISSFRVVAQSEGNAKKAAPPPLVTEIAIGLTPVGDIKDLAAAESVFDYTIALIGSLGPAGDLAKKLIKEAKVLSEAGHAARADAKLVEAKAEIEIVSRSQNIATDLSKRADIDNVQQVTAGTKGSWEKAINSQSGLKPNAGYVLDNGHSYITDATGRVKEVVGELSLSSAARNPYQQCATGKCGNVGDEGGHLIAASLGGAGDKINLVPQAASLNRGPWKAMENELRVALSAGKEVKVKIEIGYPAGGGLRPSEFRVTAIIDGKVTPYKFNQ